MVPVPYVIIGEFSEATGVSPNITSNGEPVVIHASTMVPSVKGDEAGTGKGIKSGTVGGRVQAMEKSSTLSFNGERAVRVGDLVYMNDKNTIGKVFERLDASALKAFPKACEPGGTLAVLREALDACNFIPCALLNLAPGCPVPAAASASLSSTSAARRGNNTDVLQGSAATAGKDGGVSRGRYSDPATENAIKAFNAEMLEYKANQEGQRPEYVWADDRVYPARPLTVQDVSNSAYEIARALTSSEGWSAVGKTVLAFGGQHESSTSAAAAAVGQNRVPMEKPTQAEFRQAATTLSAVPGLVQYELEFLGAISPVPRANTPEIVGPYSPLFRGEPTRLVDGVVVVERRSGTVLKGTVDLGPTIDRIEAGGSFPHRNDGSVFNNRPPVSGPTPLLPVRPPGYYTEYVVPTPNATPGPQRIVVGKGGDMYYTPDHYGTFIPLKK